METASVLTREQREKKRETFARLQVYYRTHGAGCLSLVAKASGVKKETLHGLLQAVPYPYSVWEKVGAGLDKL